MRPNQRHVPGAASGSELTVRQLIEQAGMDIAVEDFQAQVAAVASHSRLRFVSSDSSTEFDDATRAALVRAGADFSPLRTGRPDPTELTRAAFIGLLADSHEPEAVAKRLGRDVSRIRQRIRDRTLWSVTTASGVRLPTVQFDDDGSEISGMGAVVQAVPDDIHPVAVFRWLTTPVPDLVAPGEEGIALSPREWLRSGGAPEAAIELVAGLLVA
jgi:hypothetical protein